MSNDTERAAFEAWARQTKFGLKLLVGRYTDYDSDETEIAWRAWQARAAFGAWLVAANAPEEKQ
jgi:hypothetical protein